MVLGEQACGRGMSEPLLRPQPGDGTLDVRWIDRWIAGTCTPEDALAIEAWLDAAPDRRREMARMREVGMRVFAYPNVTAPEVVWERLRPSAEVEEEPRRRWSGGGDRGGEVAGFKLSRWGVGKRTLRRIALSLGIVVTLTALLVVRWAPRDLGTTYTYSTHAGQQATFTLRDGTRVTLAPQTTLRIAHFGARSRTVVLDGQAYFEVARSAETPFVVQSGDVSTRVLGTAFLVRHYANTNDVHIAVAEGKVRVVSRRRADKTLSLPMTLTAGHIGDVRDSTVLVRGMDDVASETGWLQGRLVFRNATVSSILQTLSRWYGYQFHCGDSALTEERVTAALDARSSMAALASLGEILEAHVTVNGDTVTLTQQPKRATTGTSRKQAYDVWIPTREAGK